MLKGNAFVFRQFPTPLQRSLSGARRLSVLISPANWVANASTPVHAPKGYEECGSAANRTSSSYYYRPKNTKNLTGQSPLKSEFQEIIIGLSATRKSETERQIVD